jgi:hypothetical protein
VERWPQIYGRKKKLSQGLLPDDWRRMDVDSGLASEEVSGVSSWW